MASFFVSCPLHFEPQLVIELKSFWHEMMDLDGQPTREALPELVTHPGGVELKCSDHLGYQINFFSKLALRVLIRIHKFPARYYDQFEKEMKALPLAKWIDDKTISIKIETSKSRLNHERNLTEAATKGLAGAGFKLIDKAGHRLFVRIVKDNAVISLDTSGEHLHKRGYAIFRGEAPLRENLAALMAQQLELNKVDLNYITLVDPFVGSGTTLFEAASFQIPNFKRNYAWMNFKNKPKIFNSESWVKNFRWIQNKESDALGIDIDQDALENLHENHKLFAETFPQARLNLRTLNDDSVVVQENDVQAKKPCWIISNPPYGVRLRQGSVADAFGHVEKLCDLQGAIIMHPDSLPIAFNKLRLSSQLDLSNQGLKINLSVFTR